MSVIRYRQAALHVTDAKSVTHKCVCRSFMTRKPARGAGSMSEIRISEVRTVQLPDGATGNGWTPITPEVVKRNRG